jgi:hypothetical protein
VNDGRVCVNEVAILRCSYSDQQAHILDGQLPDWKIDGGNVAFPNHVASRPSSNLNELHVNVTKLIDILCFFLIYENGEVMDSISSKSLTVHPKGEHNCIYINNLNCDNNRIVYYFAINACRIASAREACNQAFIHNK